MEHGNNDVHYVAFDVIALGILQQIAMQPLMPEETVAIGVVVLATGLKIAMPGHTFLVVHLKTVLQLVCFCLLQLFFLQ